MKTMQKLKTFIAIACAAALAFSAQAATKKVKVGKATWTLSVSGKSAQVGNGTGCAVSPRPSGALKIPSKIGNYAVKSIGANAFKDCADLTSVTIPSSVASIGAYAFSASGLKSVSVPGSVKTVGDNAFYGCTSLDNATLASGVVSVGDHAFSDCRSIHWIAMPRTLESMGEGAFFGALSSSGDREIYYEYAGDDTRLKGLLNDSGSGSNNIDFYLRCKLTLKPNNTKYGTAGAMVGGVTKANYWEFADNGTTITAKAKKGYVFVGWYADKACKTPLQTRENGGVIYDPEANFRQKSLMIVMPEKHTTLYAKFITKAADKKALKFSSAAKKLAKTPAKTTTDTSFMVKVSASSATPVTYSAKGLPSGLVINKKTGEISGEATKAGVFTVTVTAKSAGGNTITQKVKITVNAPSWVRGTYEGVALPGTKASDPPAHLKFTVGTTGKISGSVNYKGKAYSFTANCSYCSMGILRFSPSVKVGKTTFKPGTVTVKNDLPDGRERPFASCDSERFLAYKSCNFVKAGERGATYVGQSIPLSAEHDVSGLSPGKVSLNVLLGTGDRVIVSGKVNGKKVSLSTQMSLKKATTDNNTLETTYEMYADIIFPGGKYYRTLKLKFILFPDGNVGLLEPELLSIDAMWE